jgi:hypothetical protein
MVELTDKSCTLPTLIPREIDPDFLSDDEPKMSSLFKLELSIKGFSKAFFRLKIAEESLL